MDTSEAIECDFDPDSFFVTLGRLRFACRRMNGIKKIRDKYKPDWDRDRD
ncbi:MAG: hypothetical protein PHV06_03645 [bacterium]|nr:hypothetical protein [bacterium]